MVQHMQILILAPFVLAKMQERWIHTGVYVKLHVKAKLSANKYAEYAASVNNYHIFESNQIVVPLIY